MSHLYATIGRYRRFLFVGRHFQWTQTGWFGRWGRFRVLALTRPRRFLRLGGRSHRLRWSHLAWWSPGFTDWRSWRLLSTGRRPQGPGLGRPQEFLGNPRHLDILVILLSYEMMLSRSGCWWLIVHSEATGLVDDFVSVFNRAQNSLHVSVAVLENFNKSELHHSTLTNTCDCQPRSPEEHFKCYLLSDKLIARASFKRDNEINLLGRRTTPLNV